METSLANADLSEAALLPVGIDLGTTYSAVATVSQSGQTAMLPDEFGNILTPSVVYFGDREIVVGREAQRELSHYFDSIADTAKRDVGKPFYRRLIQGKSLPPEVIQACILRHLKKSIVAHLGEKSAAVITVPAFFDERRRKSTIDAGEMAGLHLLDIINEPTAAALAFGEQLGFLSDDGSARRTVRALVFDLGGGTFDVTVIELREDRFLTLATDGDVQLGGTDWDARLADYGAQKFEAEYRRDLREDPEALAKLLRNCEEAKQTLTARSQVSINIDFEGVTADIVVTREQFESLTTDLLERTAHTADQVRMAADLEWKDFDRVLLVGGSTRMPMIARRLEQLTGMPAEQSVNPDEAVARGAAIYAAHLLSKGGNVSVPLRQLDVVDVNSHSLGVEGVDIATGRKENSIVIPRNTPLPAEFVRQYVTREAGQQSIVLKVLEGETADPEHCISIGRAVMRDLPEDLPLGHPLEVTLRYAANGRLKVLLTIPGTDRTLKMRIHRGEMLTHESLEGWRAALAANGGLDAFETMLQSVLGIAEEPRNP